MSVFTFDLSCGVKQIQKIQISNCWDSSWTAGTIQRGMCYILANRSMPVSLEKTGAAGDFRKYFCSVSGFNEVWFTFREALP